MARSQRPRYEGDPTLLRVAVRLRWIAALVLALAVAGGFAWLGRWQLGTAIRADSSDIELSETVRAIQDVTEPGKPVTDTAAGMTVSLEGQLVADDFLVVAPRLNGDTLGAWVTGHLNVRDGGQLPVAIGWAASAEDAKQAASQINEELRVPGSHLAQDLNVIGRYMPSDGAELPTPEQDPEQITTMSAAQLINQWAPFAGPAYSGFVVVHPEESFDQSVLTRVGLTPIDSVPPLPAEKVNWLNLFYAGEWVIFAGFAIFFWYRLVRDDWEKEHELMLQAAEAAEASETAAAADVAEADVVSADAQNEQ